MSHGPQEGHQHEACIADDLTHMDFESTTVFVPWATKITYEELPPPIHSWMQLAQENRNLGHDVLQWMKSYYSDLL